MGVARAALQPIAVLPQLPRAHGIPEASMLRLGPAATLEGQGSQPSLLQRGLFGQLGSRGVLAPTSQSALAAPPAAPTLAAQGRLPAYVQSLVPQSPAPGPFSTSDLHWVRVEEKKNYALAAAISPDRIDDFVLGENKRGGCRINLWQQSAPKGGAMRNDRAECCYAAPKKKAQKARKKMLPSEDLVPEVEGTKPRKGALQQGTSIKQDCSYAFFLKQYSKRPDVCIVNFVCADDSSGHSCPAMQHRNPDGEPAHAGEMLHRLEHTQWLKEFVISKLRDHVMPKVIQQDVRSKVCGKLGIAKELAAIDPAAVADKIAASEHAADYYVSRHTITNLRAAHVDLLWKRAGRDVDSVARAWQEDQAKEPSARQWLHFEVDAEGKEPLVILATQYMLKQAVQRGMGEPIYMDASHDMQRYGLKVATVHVKDVEGRGQPVLWAILRSESIPTYVKVLRHLKLNCEKLMEPGKEWRPSCCLTDNSDAEIGAVRQALGCPIFLCLWHGTKAWLEQLRRKLVNKERIREAFQALYNAL